MDKTGLRDILMRQYARSWKMVEEVVRGFSDAEWRSSEVDYLIPARSAYHIVETADFYASVSPDGFPWGERFSGDWEGLAPEALPAQEAVLAYLADVRLKVDAWLGEADLYSQDTTFPWTGGCVLDRVLYLLRHNHHHVGEMWSELKRRGHTLPDWW